MLDISINLLIAALVVVAILLLVVVLMQRPKQEGLGAAFGAAVTDQAFGARTTDVLKKATVYFGTAFMVICLVLTILINRQHSEASESLKAENPAPVAESSQPKALTEEELEKQKLLENASKFGAGAESKTPAEAPVAPATPVTPQL